VWPREKAARVAPLIEVIRELVAQTVGAP
jgi:LysR family glycine cleavage system transcriptional activator